jgi:hypothetical protein
MTLTFSHIIALVGLAVAIGFGLYARRRAGTILSDIRTHFLTMHGFFVACLWWFVVAGMFGSWIVFQVQVMGNDVVMGTTDAKRKG